MKKIFILLIIVSSTSCSKNKSAEGKTCWQCNISDTQTIEQCNEGGNLVPQFTDKNGNAYGLYNCKKIIR